MDNRNLFSKDPEQVLYQEQLNRLKCTQGCAVCVDRDRSIKVFEKRLCSIKGKSPGRGGYCVNWQYDEGVEDGTDTAAA